MSKIINLFIVGIFPFILAATPANLNYQAELKTQEAQPVTSPTTVQFSFYNHSADGSPADIPTAAGPLLWTETYDKAEGPCGQIIPGDNGAFSQQLGSCTPFPDYFDSRKTYYLGVRVEGNSEAAPRLSFGVLDDTNLIQSLTERLVKLEEAPDFGPDISVDGNSLLVGGELSVGGFVFTGSGLVVGPASTTYEDGLIDSTGALSINTTNNQPVNFGTGLVSLGGDLKITGNLQDFTLDRLSGVGSAGTGSGRLLIADGNSWESVALSGDATIAAAGALTIADNAVDGTDISLTSEATGDVMYFDGTAWVRLGLGSAGQVLSVSGSLPSWQAGAAGSFTSLSDTNIIAPAAGQIAIFDGVDSWDNQALSGDATINATGVLTIAANAVALTTDTTGNYVASITNGSGITGGDGGSEGAALTLSVNQATAFAWTADHTWTLVETEDLAVNISISGTNSGQGEIITLTNSSTSGNQYGLYIDNAASTGTTEALLVVDNSDIDTAVTNGIQFIDAGGGFTNIINNAGTLISSAELNILDNNIALTSEVTGVLPIANGGTNKALTLSAGGIAYFDADSFEVLSAGTSGQLLTSGGAGAPTWTTQGSGGGLDADTLDTIDSLSFLRSDAVDTMSANSTSTLLTLTQSGTGDILNVFDGATEVFTILDGGNVGIGIASPSTTLDVVGDVNTSTDYNIGGTQVLSSTVLGSGVVGSSLTSVGTLSSLTMGGNISVLQGNQIRFSGGSGNNFIEGNVSNTGRLGIFTENIERITILLGGNVGIGDVTPDFLLDVTGTFGTDGNVTFGDASGDTVTSNAAAWTFANDTAVTLSGGVDGLNFDSNTLSIDATNNRVGIGTASPGKLLHLDTTSTNGPDIFFTDADTGSIVGSDGLQLGMDDGEHGFFWNYESAGDIYFGAGNAEVMRLDSSGNVGIGATTPGNKLHIVLDDATTNAVGDVLRIEKSTTGVAAAGLGAGLVFHVEDAGGVEEQASIDVVMTDVTDLSEDADMVFNLNRAGTITEAMRITSTGNVGIGDTTPATPLEIVSSNNVLADLAVEENYHLKLRNPNNVTGEGVGISFGMSSTNSQQTAAIVASRTGSNGQGDLRFYTKQSTTSGVAPVFAMIIDQSGNVGIGDTAPNKMLHIEGSDPEIYLHGTSGNAFESGRIRLAESTTGGSDTFKGGFIHFDGSANVFNIGVHDPGDQTTGNDVNAISIDRTTANVGIGTTTVDELLHVAKATDGDSILALLENSQANEAGSTNETAQLRFGFGGDNDVARIIVGKENDYTGPASEDDSFMAFYTDLDGTAGERMRITSAGNVGIGTTGPTIELAIGDSDTGFDWQSDGNFEIKSDGLRIIDFDSGVTNRRVIFDVGNALAGNACDTANDVLETDGDGRLRCGTEDSDERMKNVFARELAYGLDEILNTTLIQYEWNELSGHPNTEGISRYQGFSAQELLKTAPQLVVTGHDGYYGLDQNGVIAVAWNAIRELNTKVDETFQEQQVLVLSSESDVLGTAVEIEAGLELDQVQADLVALQEEVAGLKDAGVWGWFESLVQKVGDAFEFLAAVTFKNKVTFEDVISVSNNTAGVVTIPKGETKVRVLFTQSYEKEPILSLTPMAMTYDAYAVTEVTPEGFVVEIPLARDYDIAFSWIALLVEGEPIKVEVVEEDTINSIDELLGEYDQLVEEGITESTETQEPSEPSVIIERTWLRILDSELGYVRVREDPNTNSAQVSEVVPRQTYPYTDIQNDWYRIEYAEGQFGWVSGVYVEEVE